MGRRKKPQTKPWVCWYCTRDFDDERVLILHQRARHFKCGNCQKKLYTGPGLAFHCLQVHKEIIYTVPNALEKKNYITFEIYGMNGIPSEEEVEVAAKQLKNVMAAVSSSGAMQPVSNPLFPSAAQIMARINLLLLVAQDLGENFHLLALYLC
ncbi:hypothetical protein OTU49_008789 [Cherax quadricarinatus]|uniref:C2H2-type domain-containing protein n=1 Tax=Cherax quadricarinatus TaxID=27406 RepID=A0AAW0WQ50_CHEQU